MKICKKCNDEKNEIDFYRNKNSKDGRSSYCISCEKNRNRDWKKIHNRRKNNLDYRLNHAINQRILDAGVKRKIPTYNLLGCSLVEYKQYLEKLFRNGMTWDNYGTFWEIDHIIPCASFDLTRIEQQFLCFHFMNTQPLEKIANREKGDGNSTVVLLQYV